MRKQISLPRRFSVAFGLVMLATMCLSLPSHAQSVPIDALGKLELSYQTLVQQTKFEGAPLTARVGAYPNSGYPIHNVLEATQKLWLVQTGQQVSEKQAVVELSGSAVHHFLTEYDVRKQHLTIVSQRYQTNRDLFAKKAISASQWQEISLAYQTALLEFEHLDHFYENIISITDSHLSVTLAAPQSGILVISPEASVLFEVIAPQQLRFIGEIGNQTIPPTSITWSGCDLAIARIDTASTGFTKQWSSEAMADVPSACQSGWGAQVTVKPVYENEVFAVPTASVVRHQQDQYIWVKKGANLVFTPIKVMGKSHDQFYVMGESLTADTAVLKQSVGAVYGHYLGLGGE